MASLRFDPDMTAACRRYAEVGVPIGPDYVEGAKAPRSAGAIAPRWGPPPELDPFGVSILSGETQARSDEFCALVLGMMPDGETSKGYVSDGASN